MGNSFNKYKQQNSKCDVKKWPICSEERLLLLYGYIRQIEKLHSLIIPKEVYMMCESYYQFSNNVLLMTTAYGQDHHLKYSNTNTSTKWPILTVTSPVTANWRPGECGLCLKRNLTLPHQLSFFDNLDDQQSYDVLFHSKYFHYNTQSNYSGTEHHSKVEYDRTDFSFYVLSNDDTPIQRICLPSLKEKSHIQSIVFSDKHGLIAIENKAQQYIYNLPFNKDINRFLWNKFCQIGFISRNDASCLLLDKLGGNEKLFICGGTATYENIRLSDAFLLDLNTKNWSKLPDLPWGVTGASSYYHSLKNTIYVSPTCDYFGERSTILYCDLNKCKKWYKLPPIRSKQCDNALMWIDGNALYICSTSMNAIECIDLRESKKENNWKRIVQSKNGKYDTLYLTKMFGVCIDATKPNYYKLFR